MSGTQIAVAATMLAVFGVFNPRMAWGMCLIWAAGYLALGWIPFAGHSWSAPG